MLPVSDCCGGESEARGKLGLAQAECLANGPHVDGRRPLHLNVGDTDCWFSDTDYNEESFFVRYAYFLGANDPYKAFKTTLKAEINEEGWTALNNDTSRPFNKPESYRTAVKVINHLGDEVMKVFRVDGR